MAGLLEAHVRPGLAKSEGAKHKTVAAAFSDILDNCRFHGETSEGATHVKIVLGPGVNEHLVAPPAGQHWLSICDDGAGMGKSTIEWGILARGPAERPDGSKVVSYFNTGHHAAFNKLGGEEVIIATVRDNVGTLVRWGATVVDAINAAFPPPNPGEARVRSAYLQYDMRTGSRLADQAASSAAVLTRESESATLGTAISEAAFGLHSPNMQFPMRGVTPAKLLSLFAPLEGKSGTCVYTRTNQVTPEGGHIMAGNVKLQKHIEQCWWLPHSALLPWKQDLPAHRHGGASPRQFNVSLTCEGTRKTVEWQNHGWEAVVREGAASPPMVRMFMDELGNNHAIHYQIGWLNMADDLQKPLSGKMLMYRHARYTCVESLPRGRGGEECGRMNGRMEAGGPNAFPGLHDMLQDIYLGGWPVEKAKMKKLTKDGIRALLGETLVMLVSCHDFEWQEGKEAFAVNDVYPACLPALFSAAAEFALEHRCHPAVKVAERLAKEAADKKRKEDEERIAANKAKRIAEGGAAGAAGARVRARPNVYEPGEAPKLLAVEGSKKRAAPASAAAPGGKAKKTAGGEKQMSLVPIQQHVKDAVEGWPAVRTAIAQHPVAVQYVEKLLSDLQAALKMQ